MTDFYKVLGVSTTASSSEIKLAYRRRSLETHPDRFPPGSSEQQSATARFQEVNNAYHVLSDATRRREYDATRGNSSSSGFGSWFNSSPQQEQETANSQFSSAFEEMMQEEGLNAEAQGQGKFYGMAGGAAGAVLGFIVANVPGALAGAVAGNRLGNVRDTHQKAVYEVFQDLPAAEKARLLSELLAKVMGQLGGAGGLGGFKSG